MTPRLDRIDHVHIYVANRAEAERWYARVLGVHRVPELAFWADDGGPLTLADAGGGVHLALFERTVSECRSTVALAASADDFVRWQQHLAQALGMPVPAVDHSVSWSLYFSDPDGNPFEITSYEHGPVAARLGEPAGG